MYSVTHLRKSAYAKVLKEPGRRCAWSSSFEFGAGGTEPSKDDMAHVDVDAVLVLQIAGQALEKGVLEFDHRLAGAADQMVMLVDHDAPACSFVAKLHTDHQAMLFKRFKRPIDGGGVDGGVPCEHFGTQVFHAAMLVLLTQDLENGDTRTGCLQPMAPQQQFERVYAGVDVRTSRELLLLLYDTWRLVCGA
jgi:hypothetical protein